ncbi:Mitochondrial distribution and morphology protein 31 [Metarhizium anisopliae]|nr:Mitochondrial distribution and morphology protein 31 [Metarhizium anisopliae]
MADCYSNEKKPAKEHAIARGSSTSPERKRPESSQQQQEVPGQPNSEGDNESIASSVSKYLHLPKLPHRPAKEELLAAANGFWERLKVRFKWMSIRSMRPWNADEWGAFVSWFMLGHIVWILVGTTTFFSLLIFSINTVFAQAAGRQAHLIEYSDPEDDGNYTQFDVTIANVNVTLSFLNWWNGKGLLKDVEVNGVRGVVDRTSVQWPIEEVDPLSYRHEHQPGDFEIESFKLEDLLLTIYQPDGFRPFSVSIYSCELPRLRKQWLFYDFLSANHMSGSFDGSLFTIHPRQVHGIVSRQDQGAMMGLGEQNAWQKFSRLRIDGLKIDHLNRGVEGPFGWIYEGNVDIVADVMLPAETDEGITKVMADFYDQLEEAVIMNKQRLLQNSTDNSPVLLQSGHLSEAGHVDATENNEGGEPGEEDRRYIIMDMRIHMNDVKAAVPLFTRDISYVNQALVRPIVAYINAKKTYIPISCRIVKRLSDFDGSWTVFDCGLMNDASVETYDAFAKDVENQQSRVRRFKKVGFWTLSLAVHALFMGMAGNVV